MVVIFKRTIIPYWNLVTIYTMVRYTVCYILWRRFLFSVYLVMNFHFQNTYSQIDGKLKILKHTFIGTFYLFLSIVRSSRLLCINSFENTLRSVLGMDLTLVMVMCLAKFSLRTLLTTHTWVQYIYTRAWIRRKSQIQLSVGSSHEASCSGG